MWRRWLGLAALLTGCSSTSSSSTTIEPCDPGEVITCRASSGCSGEKICNEDGKGYGSCLCDDGGAGSGGTGGAGASGGAGGVGTGGATTGGSGGATTGGSGGSSASGGTGGGVSSGGTGGASASGGSGGSATGGTGGASTTTCTGDTDCPASTPHCCAGVCRACCVDNDCGVSTSLCEQIYCDTAAGTCAITKPCTDMLCCAIGTNYICCPTDKTCCGAGCC